MVLSCASITSPIQISPLEIKMTKTAFPLAQHTKRSLTLTSTRLMIGMILVCLIMLLLLQTFVAVYFRMRWDYLINAEQGRIWKQMSVVFFKDIIPRFVRACVLKRTTKNVIQMYGKLSDF